MKILVDRELIIKLAGLLKYSKNYYEGHNEAVSIVEDILESNPVESDGFNPRDTLISAKELAEIVAEGQRIYGDKPELSDRQAIIEILDMLIENELDKSKKAKNHFSTDIQNRATNLKAKLVGEQFRGETK